MSDNRLVFGLEPQHPLPEGWTPLEFTGMLKCLTEEGETALILTATKSLSSWEALGMLYGAVRVQEGVLAEMFVDDEDDDEPGLDAGE